MLVSTYIFTPIYISMEILSKEKLVFTTMIITTNHFNQFKMQTTPSVQLYIQTTLFTLMYINLYFTPIHAVSMFSLSFLEQYEFSMLSTFMGFYNFAPLF